MGIKLYVLENIFSILTADIKLSGRIERLNMIIANGIISGSK